MGYKVKNSNKTWQIINRHKRGFVRPKRTGFRRYYHKTTRNAVKALRNTTDKAAAEALLPKVSAMLDKLAKRNVIHANKAGNLKSSIQKHVNAL